MGRLIGLVLGVAALWIALEVYNHGVDGAFDGALAGARAGATPAASVPQRAGAAVEGAHTKAAARRDALLAE